MYAGHIQGVSGSYFMLCNNEQQYCIPAVGPERCSASNALYVQLDLIENCHKPSLFTYCYKSINIYTSSLEIPSCISQQNNSQPSRNQITPAKFHVFIFEQISINLSIQPHATLSKFFQYT